jgi:hypothetical protein
MSQPSQGPWQNPQGGNPFTQGDNPFGDQPSSMNPYAPGMAPPPPAGHDPALGLVVPINTSIWAIAAGYLGLLGLALCFLAPFAILCGVMAFRDIRRHPGMRGHVRATVGIVLGLVGTLFLALVLLSGLASAGR